MDTYKIDKFQTKHIYMLEKLVALNIIVPEIQREIDIDRVDNIISYQLEHFKKCKDFCFLGELTFVNIDNDIFIVDGMHRYDAIKRLYLQKPDYKICVNMINCSNQLTMADIFCLLNKAEPVPEYIIKTTNDMSKRYIIDGFLKLFKKEYKSYISKSKLPQCPNINIDIFSNLIESEIFKRYHTAKEIFRFFEWVNINKFLNINLEISEICIKKGENNETKPLFLYNDIQGRWMNDDSFIKEYEDELENIYDQGVNSDPEAILYKKKRKNIPKPVRFAVWKKINTNCTEGLCVCCENPIDINNYECGHIISFFNGGSDYESNLLPICSMCNKSMGVQNMNEFCEINKMAGKSYFNNNEKKADGEEDGTPKKKAKFAKIFDIFKSKKVSPGM